MFRQKLYFVKKIISIKQVKIRAATNIEKQKNEACISHGIYSIKNFAAKMSNANAEYIIWIDEKKELDESDNEALGSSPRALSQLSSEDSHLEDVKKVLEKIQRDLESINRLTEQLDSVAEARRGVGNGADAKTYEDLKEQLQKTMKETNEWKSSFIKELSTSKTNIIYLIDATAELKTRITAFKSKTKDAEPGSKNVYKQNCRAKETIRAIFKWTSIAKRCFGKTMPLWDQLASKANSLKQEWSHIAALCGALNQQLRSDAEEMARRLQNHQQHSRSWKETFKNFGVFLGKIILGIIGGVIGGAIGAAA
ncbi:chromosome segregation protein, partial [Reticulomyxa filosa]